MHHPRNTPVVARPLRFAPSAIAAALLALAGGGAHAVQYVWSSGNYVPGVTASNPLAAGDVLDINSGGNKFITSVTLDVLGTVNWNADTLYMQSGGTVNNAGLWLAVGDNVLQNNGGASPAFNNSGVFRKAGSAGTTTVGGLAFANSGTIDTQTGTTLFNGGNASFNAGSVFTGAGRTVIGAAASFNGAFTSSNLALSAGTFTGNNAVLNGSVAYEGGVISGSWEVAAGQQLVGSSGSNKYVIGGTLTNKGTIAWQTGDAWYLQSAGNVDNQGLLAVTASAAIHNNGGTTPVFTNSGTASVSAGNTLTWNSVAFVNNGGTLLSDGAMAFNGNNARFNNGTVFSGTGQTRINSNAMFVDGFQSQNLVLAGGNFQGGDGSAGSKAVAGGIVTFNGGAFTGNWQVGAGQTLAATAGSNKFFLGSNLENLGTVSWNTAETAYMQSGGVLDNRGTFAAAETMLIQYNGGTQPTFNNHGSLTAAAGKTLTVGGVAFFNKSGGTIDPAGTVVFNGAYATFEGGTLFGGSGQVRIANNASFTGSYSGSNVYIDAGTSTGSGAVLNGITRFSGGTISGSWTIAAGQTLSGVAGSNKFFTNEAIDNLGTISWDTTDTMYMQSGGTIDNRGLLVGTQSALIQYNGGAMPALNNHGTLRAAAGATLTVGGVAYTNKSTGVVDAQGTVNFNGGNAQFDGGSSFAGPGRVNINSNATFGGSFSGSNLYLNAGIATGSGAVVHGVTHFTGGTLSGAWTVAPGQQLRAESGSNKFLTAGTIDNAGTLALTAGEPLYLQSGGTINNGALIDFQADGSSIVYNGGTTVAIHNTGRIVKSAGTGSSTIGNGVVLDNLGTIDVQTGTLALPGNFVNDGVMKGVGTYFVGGSLTNAGHMQPGASPGTLTLSSNYVQTAAGFFDVEVSSTTVHDLLNVSGNVSLNGELAVACFGACSFAVGDQFVVLDYSGTRAGTFASLTLTGATGMFEAVYDDANTQVLLRATQTVTAVPEPETWALWLGGLAALGTIARRRRQA